MVRRSCVKRILDCGGGRETACYSGSSSFLKMLWNNFAGVLFEIPELANFSGWMVAEDLDAAVWFWLLVKSISDGKEITRASGVGELFLPKLLWEG